MATPVSVLCEVSRDISSLSVGQEFSSFRDLSSTVSMWERANFVTLYTRSSRKVEAARQRAPQRRFNDDLEYAEVDYACVHGGRQYKSKSTNLRLCQKTFLKNCPFTIKVRTTTDGQKLYIKEIADSHNHELTEEVYKHMPKQRRLDSHSKEEAVQLLQLKSNRKLVQTHLCQMTGKAITMKDVHNVATKNIPHLSNDFPELVQEMKKVQGSVVTAFVGDDKMLKALYFQTKEMKNSFCTYPELLLIDATYKLNDLQMPLYVLMVVDGNGESEVVCLWLTQFEDKETITELVREFKKHNENWCLIQCIMSDKDMTERNVLKEEISQAKLMICLFHTLRSMRREVSCEKLGISQGERSMCLELLTKMAYANSEDNYCELYAELKKCAPQRVMDYFNENWHKISSQWVDGMKNMCCNFMNRTNNRVESINQKLKAVISRYSGVTQFFRDLMKCLHMLKMERDHRALQITMKRAVYHPSDSVISQYMSLLTPYSLKFVIEQFNNAPKVKVLEEIDGVTCLVQSKGKELNVSTSSCPCGFVSSMLLPCRHIFAVRKHKGFDEYDESLCAERWKLSHFTQHHRAYCLTGETELQAGIEISEHVPSPSSSNVVLNEQQKYRKAFKIAQVLSQQLSSFGMRDFNEGIKELQIIREAWENGKRIKVYEDNADTDIGMSDEEMNGEIRVPPTPPLNEPAPHKDFEATPVDDNALSLQATGTTGATQHSTVSQKSAITCTDDNQASCTQAQNNNNLSHESIKMPPPMRKRGRPKGAGLTVIGLPKKRGNTPKIVAFAKKSEWEKSKAMLGWFLDQSVVERVIHDGDLVEEEEVESCPEKIPTKCLDDNVCIDKIRRYFIFDAWSLVQNCISTLKMQDSWYCASCSTDLDTDQSLACDSCLEWYHLKCVGLIKAPKAKHWFCRNCRK